MSRLTTPEFWDNLYEGWLPDPFDPTNWREYVSIQLVQLLTSLGLAGKRVLEVGGGDARLLAWLAKQHPTSKFVVLD
uniref:class I SAM-dependent methyltransferase n=1 Tax=uncultured Thermanaerothrix sp. TaxID=1195149 RepID=UPI002610B8D0